MTELPQLNASLAESSRRIEEIRDEMEVVLSKRDYRRALMVQAALRKTAAEHDRLVKEQREAELNAQIKQLEAAREREQEAIIGFANDRLAQIREHFSGAYDELLVRHRQTIAELQDRFASPVYTAIKISPTVRSLQRAESFFVKSADFVSAAQIRKQIQRQTRLEVSNFESTTRATIEAKLRDTIAQHEAEQRAFAHRLHNEREELVRDAERKLLTISNKYRKIYHKLTGRAEQSFDLTSAFSAQLREYIGRNFAEFGGELRRRGHEEDMGDAEEDHTVVTPPPRPLSSRRGSARSLRVHRPKNPRVEIALAHAPLPADWTKDL
jgi:hypothetical protein